MVAAASARRTASVCSGTFLLAQAGLLHGKRAATHWAMCDLLQERFPAIDIDRDSLFVRQQAVWTSAGVTAGIDLALALVEGDCGHEVAMQVARELVVFLKRQGGQAQFIERPLPVSAGDGRVAEVLDWVGHHLELQHSIEALAARAAMSRRNFTRHFRQATGTSFKQWLLNQRLADLGYAYGDFPGHDGLWEMAERTRDDLLARDGHNIRYRAGSDCEVVAMDLVDPYTGQRIDWSKRDADEVQVDHVVPLAYGWRMGARRWPMGKRVAFAQDPLNLLPVKGSANEAKDASGPASWLPPRRQVRCAYVTRFAQVAVKYDLPVTRADKAAMLRQCR